MKDKLVRLLKANLFGLKIVSDCDIFLHDKSRVQLKIIKYNSCKLYSINYRGCTLQHKNILVYDKDGLKDLIFKITKNKLIFELPNKEKVEFKVEFSNLSRSRIFELCV